MAQSDTGRRTPLGVGVCSTMLSVTPNEHVTFKLHYEDADLLVIEKPARRVTQPGKGHETDTILNGLFFRFGKPLQNLGKARDFGLLHRLDKMTSGLLLVALRPKAYDALRAAFEARLVRKFYWAICQKAPKAVTGIINKPLLESEPRIGETKTARIARSGKPAITAYRTLAVSPVAALIEARPLTGRLHQVRVHLDAIGCPILGDDLYAPPSFAEASPRLALHAHRLAFTHPASGEPIDIHSAFPRDLRALLKRLSLPRPDLPEEGAAEPREEAEEPELDAGGESVGDE